MTSTATDLDRLCVNTVRTLAIDAVQRANSGHPGAAMALAPLGVRLFTRHMSFDPTRPDWADRDRFILSCGHASMLLYGLLHLSGYDVTMEDLQRFRQLGSPTPGHPERGELPGVETTTGPLGQGFANAVGMALAERMLADRYGTDDTTMFDHMTWVLASDGDMMEGVQAEAAALAGHWGLGRLVVFWDDNRITIDGPTTISTSEDVAARFAAYGWQVLHIDDVDDLEAIDAAVAEARADTTRPTLVATRTHIGVGSPLQDNAKAHGAPLGEDNVRATKEVYGWPVDEPFHIPDEVREAFAVAAESGRDRRVEWDRERAGWEAAHPAMAAELERRLAGELPAGWDADLFAQLPSPGTGQATRQSSGAAINAIAPHLPELIGGSADLAESNLTTIKDGGFVASGGVVGRNIHFGIREHAMASICNGLAAHGGFRPFAGTFLIFSDYMRPAIRLAALMGLPVTYVFTHDSVWLGEDGPTHQPIEHLAALRAMPNLVVIRPADAVETAAAWRVALRERTGPVALALTRQKLPVIAYGQGVLKHQRVERGAYVLREPDGDPDLILIGTGSEVHLCLDAASILEDADGLRVRVVSMPSHELFARQSLAYRHTILPAVVPARLAVEAASSFGWCGVVGEYGETVSIDTFGASAPGDVAAAAFGMSVDNVVSRARALVRRLAGEAGRG